MDTVVMRDFGQESGSDCTGDDLKDKESAHQKGGTIAQHTMTRDIRARPIEETIIISVTEILKNLLLPP